MKKIHSFLLTTAISLVTATAFAQNVAINEDGSAANPNAILDIKSFNKGILIPRVSTSGRLAIPNTKGLLVYDTTAGSLFYNSGTAWQSLAPGTAAWSLTGNSITDTSKFLGTTGSTPLLIKVNNRPSGRIELDYPGNTFWGYNAGASIPPFNGFSTIFGTYNTAIGSLSLAANTVGGYNAATGYSTLYANTNGSLNVANGYFALHSNTTGSLNTASGANSMGAHTTGNWNTAYGANSLSGDTSGVENTTSGFQSMYSNSNGSYNTASGSFALSANSTGSYNTAVGRSASGGNTTGNYNTTVGYNAGPAGSSDNNNTAIGAFSYISTGFSNSTAIGYSASVNTSNKVRIGNGAVTVIEGQVPFTTPSDGRFKYQVREDVKGLDFIMQLRPVTYQFDVKRFDEQQSQHSGDQQASPASYVQQAAYTEAAAIRRSGFIAQEVEKAADVSGYNFSGIIKPKTEQDHYSLSYESFVVPLVKAVQEQQKIIATQNQELADLKQQVAELSQLIHSLKTK